MYKILERPNYKGEKAFHLYENGIYLWKISEKDLEKFKKKNIPFDDGEAIAEYKEYNNL